MSFSTAYTRLLYVLILILRAPLMKQAQANELLLLLACIDLNTSFGRQEGSTSPELQHTKPGMSWLSDRKTLEGIRANHTIPFRCSRVPGTKLIFENFPTNLMRSGKVKRNGSRDKLHWLHPDGKRSVLTYVFGFCVA